MSAPTSADPSNLRPAPLVLADISAALRFGVGQFRAIPLLSMAFATLFVIIGTALFALLEFSQIAPMSLSLAGGFMLVGPVLLAGFFAVSDKLRRGRHPVFGDIWAGFRNMPRGGWVISFANDEEFAKLHAAIRLLLPIIPALNRCLNSRAA